MDNKSISESGDDELLTRREASLFLKTSYTKLQLMEKNNEIPFIKIGRRTYYLKSALIDWLKMQMVVPKFMQDMKKEEEKLSSIIDEAQKLAEEEEKEESISPTKLAYDILMRKNKE